MFNENKVITEITALTDGYIQVKETTTIDNDGEFVSRKDHYSTIHPNQDLTGLPSNVVAVCNAVWTPEILAAHQKKKDDAAEAQRLAEELAAKIIAE